MTNYTMTDIEALCKECADRREKLEGTVDAIQQEQRAAVRRRLHVVKRQAADAAAAEEALKDAIAASPRLFVRPRTVPFHGLVVGFKKQPGRLEHGGEATIARIRSVFPDREAELIRTKETLDASALKKLDAKDLARIGASVVEVGDAVVVKASRTDLEKVVAALTADFEDVE